MKSNHYYQNHLDRLTPVDELKFGVDPVTSKLTGERRTLSRIDEHFDQDLRKFILDCVNGEYDEDDSSNVNVVAELYKQKLIPLGFTEIGTGSNRMAFLKDGYLYKIAMDRRGCVDNLSEYLRSIEEPDLLAKVYETNRIIAVVEYCTLINKNEFLERKDTIRDMLDYLSRRYVMQDLGTTEKNYCNIGLRPNGSLVFIDYAYMYKIAGNEDALRCRICGGFLAPNENFTGYVCTNKSCEQQYLTYEIINHMKRDVDECDDESIVKIIGTDDQGTDSSNFTYVKITGGDVGETDLIDEETAMKTITEIEKRRQQEEEYLDSITKLQNITIDDLQIDDETADEAEDIPKFNLKSEGANVLTTDELETIKKMAEDMIKPRGDMLYRDDKKED